jgi:methyl-branched lipid omega-hydroxylase
MASKPPFAITHAPGHMFITDVEDRRYVLERTQMPKGQRVIDAISPPSKPLRVLPAGDRALLVAPDDHADLAGFVDLLRRTLPTGVEDVLPGAQTVLVTTTDTADRVLIESRLRRLVDRFQTLAENRCDDWASEEVLTIPVRYDGPDLAGVAALLGTSVDSVIAHTSALWRCAFIGFAPGFGYLESSEARLGVPRRTESRTLTGLGSAVALLRRRGVHVGIAKRVNGSAPPDVPLADIDLGSWNFWSLDDDIRDGAFATLRREAPISFFPALETPGVEDHVGHWALTRHDDIWQASRHPLIFSSSPSIVINDANPELSEYFGSMIVLDDPRHGRLRNIVRTAFTPKVVARTEAAVRERAQRLVAAMIAQHPDGAGEVVSELAGPLPLQVICDMMGIPEEDHQKVFHWTNVILGFGDPDIATDYEEFVKVAVDIGAFAAALAEDRRVNPVDDLTTALVQAEVDGERLTSGEIASFFILLVVAGNETTRNAISHGVLALSRYPDERTKWWADYNGMAPTAVEEIVRWASPVIYMRRRVTEDTELSGTKLAAGDKVTMWYCSANRDEAKFADPWTFDLGRSPNAHVGFGGGGAHFCLGANLARREISVAFEELHRQIPDIEATEEPARLLSAFIHGIKRLPVSWTPPN